MILMHFSLFGSVESVKIITNSSCQICLHWSHSSCDHKDEECPQRSSTCTKRHSASDSKSALWIFLYSGSILSLDLAVKPTKSSPSTRSQACTISKPVSHQVVIWASRLVQCSCASSSLVWYLDRPPFTARTMGSDKSQQVTMPRMVRQRIFAGER